MSRQLLLPEVALKCAEAKALPEFPAFRIATHASKRESDIRTIDREKASRKTSYFGKHLVTRQ